MATIELYVEAAPKACLKNYVQPIEPVALLNILWMVKWAFVVR